VRDADETELVYMPLRSTARLYVQRELQQVGESVRQPQAHVRGALMAAARAINEYEARMTYAGPGDQHAIAACAEGKDEVRATLRQLGEKVGHVPERPRDD
jgi:hypothetical protein